ncbi:hypothetical protein H6G80_04010 [Nostoc sp. FACHB-87]|uniref:hypothetical protein n=1 Tax=Nostocaceae TaxID=1162 RepID=UPI0016823A72|nr:MULTISPECIES: hypothetical protein [Nostocaceae]MBD2453239.1 hypothetical protein [Nostoc sp. FACHB-87]MBD2474981.1 hypothetical protein [Anabaena sp. FACHB-83]
MPDEERYKLLLEMSDDDIDYSDIPPINTKNITLYTIKKSDSRRGFMTFGVIRQKQNRKLLENRRYLRLRKGK